MVSLYKDRFLPELRDALGALCDLYIYIDGDFYRGNDARISVWEHGFLYGDAVFEGIRAYDGNLFLLEEHLERLVQSAKSIDIDVPLTIPELAEVVATTFWINKLQDGHLRVSVSRGVGSMGLNPANARSPSVVAMAYPFAPLLGRDPISLVASSVRRRGPDNVDAKVKSANYLENILAKIQGNNCGASDAILLDSRGFVSEATAMNIFCKLGRKWYTPTTSSCLDGVTRRVVMEIVSEMGMEVCVRDISLHELYVADEVLCTGTGAEIVPVGVIDGRKIGNTSPGAHTEKIIEKFKLKTSVGEKILDLVNID